MITEIKGDLIKLALEGKFDVIAHGCNCFCTQKSGLAPQMVRAFATDAYPLETALAIGDIRKLGNIDYRVKVLENGHQLTVVNAYTQYGYRKEREEQIHLNYSALTLVMDKINHLFKGKKIGLPKIGAGRAGGNWQMIRFVIEKHLKDCHVTIVHYDRD